MLEIQDWLLNAVLQKVNLGEQFNLTDWSVCKANIEVKMLGSLPNDPNLYLESKSLGLLPAHEIKNINEQAKHDSPL